MTAWSTARNLLLVRLDNLGDVLMSTPAMQALRDSVPGRRLTLIASRSGAALAPHLPWIDEVITYDAPWVKGPGEARHASDDARFIEDLRRREFDAAVVFTVCTQSPLPAALMCRLAGIPLCLAHARENPYDLLSDWRPEQDACVDDMRHEVRRQLDLVASVGCQVESERLRFEVRPVDRDSLRQRLVDIGIDPDEHRVVLHPGATAPSRRYPVEGFGRAASLVARAFDGPVLVVGSAGDQVSVDGVMRAARAHGDGRVVALPADLSLGELAALIESAAALMCNNSAPAHLAAAVGTPVTVLYALTNIQHTPWQVSSRVLNRWVPCRHCLKSVCPQAGHPCLTEVSPEEVASATCFLLDTAAAGA